MDLQNIMSPGLQLCDKSTQTCTPQEDRTPDWGLDAKFMTALMNMIEEKTMQMTEENLDAIARNYNIPIQHLRRTLFLKGRTRNVCAGKTKRGYPCGRRAAPGCQFCCFHKQ